MQLIRIKRIDADSKDHVLKLLVTVKGFIARGYSTKTVLLKQNRKQEKMEAAQKKEQNIPCEVWHTVPQGYFPKYFIPFKVET